MDIKKIKEEILGPLQKLMDDKGITETGANTKGKFKAKNTPEFFPIFRKRGVEINGSIFKE